MLFIYGFSRAKQPHSGSESKSSEDDSAESEEPVVKKSHGSTDTEEEVVSAPKDSTMTIDKEDVIKETEIVNEEQESSPKNMESSETNDQTFQVENAEPEHPIEATPVAPGDKEDHVFIEAEAVPPVVSVVRELLSSVETEEEGEALASPVAAPRRSLRNIEATFDFEGAKDEASEAEVAANTTVTVSSSVPSDVVEETSPAPEPSPADQAQDVEEQPRVRRTTRTKAVKETIQEEAPVKRSTRTVTKNKKASSDNVSKDNTGGDQSASEHEASNSSEKDNQEPARRVTRSKVAPKQTLSGDEASEPKRSTRTFSKKESSSVLTKPAASPRVKELAAKVMSPASVSTPPRTKNLQGYTGSPIQDRVKHFEAAIKESAGLSSGGSGGEEEVVKTPTRQYFTPKRKSSIANSLRKVSAARNMQVAQVLAEQEVTITSPQRKGPTIRKSPGAAKPKANLNNSRAPANKIVKPGTGKKVLASGGRGVTPGSGSSNSGSSSLVRSRSRMGIIERATTPQEKAGRTTPSGKGPANLRVGVTSFLPQKPKGPTIEEIQEKKDEERRMKEQREAEAKKRKEELMKSKAEEAKRAREERIQRVKQAREKQESQKEKEIAKKIEEKETQEKLAVLKKREEMHKEAERKRKEAEKKEAERVEAEERHQREEEERKARIERENKLQEEKKKERQLRIELLRKAEEQKRAEERKAQQIAEKERILREQSEMQKLKEREAERVQSELNSTYNKPADSTFSKNNQTFDTSTVSCSGISLPFILSQSPVCV